jgi:tetratricopeptide (TPR) repeat protein
LALIGSIAGCGSGSGTPLLPGENYSRKDALAGVERGKPVVRAVLQFEADTGLWPQDLADLVPDYITADDVKTWRYHTFHHDDFALVYLGPLTGGTLHYDQDPGKPGAWNVWWEVQPEQYQPTKLNGVQSEPPPTKLSPELQTSKRLALLNRRFNAAPDRIAHRIGLMKYHWDLGNLKEARAICAACVDKWLDYWWSYLMLAKIEGRLGDQSDAERRLKGLSKRWNDFYGFAFLAQFYFDQKDVEKCKAALRQALKQQPTQLKERYTFEQIGYRQSWVDDCYYHNAAYLAYRIGDRPLCLAICDRWMEFVRDVQNYGGEEERALRVVCAVNEADWETAARLLQTMRKSPNFASWQEDGTRVLEGVVRAKNARYEYDPKLFRPAGAPLIVEFEYK